MSELMDEQREQEIRDDMGGKDPASRSRFLLRLLDAERARADAAERELQGYIRVAERRARQAKEAADFWANW